MVSRLPDSGQVVFSQTLTNVYANAQQHVDANRSFSEAFKKELVDLVVPPRVPTRSDIIFEKIWNKVEDVNKSHPILMRSIAVTSGILLISTIVSPIFFFYRR